MSVQWRPPTTPDPRTVVISERQADVLAGIVCGHSNAEIGRRMGVTHGTVSYWASRKTVRVATAETVRKLYDELSMIPGPSVKSRQYATRRGWPPPLSWNDDDGPGCIDDPAAKPMHNLQGHVPGRPRDTDREQQVMHLTRCGVSVAGIAMRLRMHERQVERIRARYREAGEVA